MCAVQLVAGQFRGAPCLMWPRQPHRLPREDMQIIKWMDEWMDECRAALTSTGCTVDAA